MAFFLTGTSQLGCGFPSRTEGNHLRLTRNSTRDNRRVRCSRDVRGGSFGAFSERFPRFFIAFPRLNDPPCCGWSGLTIIVTNSSLDPHTLIRTATVGPASFNLAKRGHRIFTLYTVSVDTIHDQNASGWHFATSVVERAIRQLIIGICDRIGASWPSEPTRDA